MNGVERWIPFFANSPDGTRLAYDCSGAGPALVLLHGGGGSRQEWHAAGYVARLQAYFKVIALDLRGHGESDLPTDPADYTIDKMVQDVLAVADACGEERFALWGMSYGGKVGRYLASRSARVTRCALMSATLGVGLVGQLRQDAIEFCAHWPPVVQALRQGSLAPASLSPQEQDMLRRLNVPVMLGWVRAMLDWPAVEPADFLCPALWLVGSQDEEAMESASEYGGRLEGTQIRLHILEGLDHEQVFDEIERVFPLLLAFMQAS
jgi:pimeloyl-ACP methyl ester carboxylesterase